ncbi:MAG: hypothetical protein KAS01_02330 [Candidatus Pacebacteria bacterium]|nr:hypothetical protein [Candidatus Paceibacterota bacterium]
MTELLNEEKKLLLEKYKAARETDSSDKEALKELEKEGLIKMIDRNCQKIVETTIAGKRFLDEISNP